MNQNLEALIEEHSAIMAEQMVSTAAWAGSEEDVRVQCTKLIDEFIDKAGLSIQGRHEYGLAGGRIDSKYAGVVIEYKHPKGASGLTGGKDSAGVKAVVKQVKRRFHDLHAEENVDLDRIFGVGCDGQVIVFVRQRGKTLNVEDPQPVTPHTVQRLLRALVSLGARGLSFTPENLAASFGSESASAQEGVRLIHELIHTTANPKARTFFDQWKILFGEVCGYDISGTNTRIEKLAAHYDIKSPDAAELLFSVHTYYALFIKLLAAEIASSFSPLGTSPLKRVVSAPTVEKLREELHALEQGSIWAHLGIRNFLEGDLFSWYLDAWDTQMEAAVRSMSLALDHFDPSTLSVDPAESRDLLKRLYQQLFPKSIRHDLGEYYTPDWLAELVLDETEYDGNPDKRLLDPACGSGTFLVMAINRVKSWYAAHRHDCGFGEAELAGKILENVVGFDLNPLAVMASRTNYLLAIRDLLRYTSDVELPVYLCDSIMTPSEYGDLFTGGHGKARLLKTSAAEFAIPNEIAEDREQIGRYADMLEFCVRNAYTPEEFIERCGTEGIPVSETPLHKELYGKLVQLDADNKNGVWARIIKNAFAPLFVGKADYVVGNPPWVNWESLPADYRRATGPLWQEYDLFRHTGYQAKLGGVKDDVSILMTYVAHDSYLREGGRLGFVITQSVFKTVGGGEGFRTFEYTRAGSKWYLQPIVAHDLSSFQPFEGAANRTAIIVVGKEKQPFSYPVPYVTWTKTARGRIPPEASLEEVKESTVRRELRAQPVDSKASTSPWLTAPRGAIDGIQKVVGKSEYVAYGGCCTWLNGVFWVRVLEKRPNGDLLIENLHDVGKINIPHVQTVVEADLVYPLLRCRDVRAWYVDPSIWIILPNRTDKLAGIPESVMRVKYPKTYEYLRQFEGDPRGPSRGTLRGRSGYRQFFKPTDPFYSVYNVGPYTMAEYKVAWCDMGVGVRVSAVLDKSEEWWDAPRLTIPGPHSMFVTTKTREESYYVAAVLGSSPAQLLIASYAIGTGVTTHVPKHVRVPSFRPTEKLHERLVELSQECHSSAKLGVAESVENIELAIDQAASQLWGITDDELEAIRAAMAEA